MSIELSVIVPVCNEIHSVRILHQAIRQSMETQEMSWEVVYVDDGSTDGSTEVLAQLSAEDGAHIRVVVLRRNFGQTAAIVAGIDHALGDVIVPIDADLQNDPADIPMMLSYIHQGYDVVSGWRVNRKDNLWSRRLPSVIGNWLISKVTHVSLHDYGCTLKAYRREVFDGFRLYGEMHRFIPVYAHMVGANIIEVPVQHHPRQHGKSKYSLKRTIKVFLDLFTVKFLLDYAAKPIYLFGGTGIGLFVFSFLVMVYLIIMRILFDEHMVRSPLFMMSMILFILGFQSILLGLIAEMLARTYHESQSKRTYTVRKVIEASSGSAIKPAETNGS